MLVLALAALASASIGDNTLEERRVFVEPVLAPPRDSRTNPTDRSRQFPILVLLSQKPPGHVRPEPSGKSLEGSPIYVKVNFKLSVLCEMLRILKGLPLQVYEIKKLVIA